MNWKSGAILVVVLGALIFLLLRDRGAVPTPAVPAPLLGCSAANSVLFDLAGSAGHVRYERSDAKSAWRQLTPAPAEGSMPAVDQLAGDLAQLSVTRDVDPGPAGSYGLDKPRLTVTCRTGTGTSYTLALGESTFDGSGTYARLTGDARVRVVPSSGAQSLVQDLSLAVNQATLPPTPIPSGAPSPSPST